MQRSEMKHGRKKEFLLMKHDFHLNGIFLREILPLWRCTTTFWSPGSEGESNTISLRQVALVSSICLPNLTAVLYCKEFLRREEPEEMRALECQYNVLSAHAWSSWEQRRFWADPLHCSPERTGAGSSSQST